VATFLCKACRLGNVSRRQLERRFRTALKRGIHEYYLSLRLERTLQLLCGSPLTMLEISIATGFTSASHFSRALRSALDVSPSEFQRGERSV
jgi:transcriptional regulator GlxA family with amidase domain